VVCSSVVATSGWCLGLNHLSSAQEHKQKNDNSQLQIRLVDEANDDGRRFVVSGLDDTLLQRLSATADGSPDVWRETMVVTVATDGDSKARPMLGDYSIEDAALTFTPRFPLRKGMTYRVVVFTVDRNQPTTRDFPLAAGTPIVPSRIVSVFPSTNILPENQLKFYLQFSRAMRRGEAYSRVKLIDQSGKQVEFPFLELGEELWDPSGSRFTLFFDPGRIKRGLKPRELFGPALEEGRSYTLVIDQQWESSDGQPLQAAHRKSFKVVAPDDKQPSPADWQIVTPAADSRDPLVVSFGEPLDHGMLQRVLTVTYEGISVVGRNVISKQETQWSFQPAAAWKAGTYALMVDAALEDLAGNSIGRPFEVDVFDQVERKPSRSTVAIPFVVEN